MQDRSKRILQIIDYKKLNKVSFAEQLGVSQQYVTKITKPNSSIGEKTVNNIIAVFPEVNKEWLLNGDGEMLVSDKKKQIFIGRENKVELDKFVDFFLLHKDKIEKNDRFINYIESIEKDAIIRYQQELIDKMNKK